MKSYTEVEKSKKLAEILPVESADMRYAPFGDIHPWFWDGHLLEKGAIPCWSLSALIELMGECRMERTPLDQSGAFTHSFVDDYFNIRTYEEYDIVDAAVEMILKLHEQKLI